MQPGADEDLQSIAPRQSTKLAAAIQGAAGCIIALAALQVILSLEFDDPWLDLVPRIVCGAGVVVLVLAIPIYGQRLWACLVALSIDILLTLVLAAWAIYSLVLGIYSCMQIVAVPLALASAVTVGFALGAAARAERARRALRDAGEGFGL